MNNHQKAVLLSVILLLPFPAQAINKCTDKNGKVSYQDRPCSASQTAEKQLTNKSRDSNDTNNVEPVYVTIPGVGDGILLSYKWWDFSIIQPNPESPPTVKMVSKAGEEPISFSISFIPNKNGKAITLEESSNTVYQMASRYLTGAVEKEVKLHKLDTTIGTAFFASFTEEKYIHSHIPSGEFSSITVGQAAHSKLVVGFTILTNGTNSKSLEEALNIIGSFQVVLK